MAFQIKDFRSIAASMVNWMRAAQGKVTDFEPGGVARTMLEAPAAEIDELYQQVFNGIREAIPVSIYRSFQFPVQEAGPAGGYIRVTITPITADTLIAAGTIFQRSLGGQVQNIAIADSLIPGSSSFVDVPVAADQAGAVGNAPEGTEFKISPQPLGFLSAISIAGLSGGTDGETEGERAARFAEYVRSLERGTDRAILYGASLANIRNAAGVITERVTSARIITPYEVDPLLYTPGLIWLYIENRTGAVSSDLLNRCQEVIDGYTRAGIKYPGWKGAGVQCEVRAATRVPVNVTATLAARDGYDAATLRAAAVTAIYAYLAELPINEPALRAEMVKRVMAIAGVLDFNITVPSSNATASTSEKLAPGTLTIT